MNKIKADDVQDPGRWYKTLRKSLGVASTDGEEVRERYWCGNRSNARDARRN